MNFLNADTNQIGYLSSKTPVLNAGFKNFLDQKQIRMRFFMLDSIFMDLTFKAKNSPHATRILTFFLRDREIDK